jgi:16S rRNA (guanine966-N2)-methyltransferase
VLDLYAGSGALGLESLSRGAASADLVEQGRGAAAVVRRNVAVVAKAGATASARVHESSVRSFLQRASGPFDLVFSDPPYAVDAAALSEDLTRLAASRLADGALVVVERSARSTGDIWPRDFDVVVDKNYGDTRVEVGEFIGS